MSHYTRLSNLVFGFHLYIHMYHARLELISRSLLLCCCLIGLLPHRPRLDLDILFCRRLLHVVIRGSPNETTGRSHRRVRGIQGRRVGRPEATLTGIEFLHTGTICWRRGTSNHGFCFFTLRYHFSQMLINNKCEITRTSQGVRPSPR